MKSWIELNDELRNFFEDILDQEYSMIGEKGLKKYESFLVEIFPKLKED